jgi:hypothetical protein
LDNFGQAKLKIHQLMLGLILLIINTYDVAHSPSFAIFIAHLVSIPLSLGMHKGKKVYLLQFYE